MQQPNRGSVSPGPARSDAEPIFPLGMHANNAHACGWLPLINTSSTTDEDGSLLLENIYLCMMQIPSVASLRQSVPQLAPGSPDLPVAPHRDRNTHRCANACHWLLLNHLFSPVSSPDLWPLQYLALKPVIPLAGLSSLMLASKYAYNMHTHTMCMCSSLSSCWYLKHVDLYDPWPHLQRLTFKLPYAHRFESPSPRKINGNGTKNKRVCCDEVHGMVTQVY